MELFRPAARATIISFPIKDLEGRIRTGATSLDSEWIAWADTAGPTAAGNPGWADMAGESAEIGTTGTYTLAVAAAELPAASPYVMIRVISGNAATQYVLIRTASTYANITGINGTNIAAPVTAGYMPVDVQQTISLSAPADNSIAKALARSYMAATHYIDAAITSRPTAAAAADAIWDEVITSGHTTDNTAGLMASRLYHATPYVSSATMADVVWDEAIADHVADNTFGKGAQRLYYATPFTALTIGTVSTVSAIAANAVSASALAADAVAEIADGVWDEVILSGHTTDNTAGLLAQRLYHATDYLNAAVTSRLAPTTAARTLDVDASGGAEVGSFQTGAITAAAFAANALEAAGIAVDVGSEFADAFLGRTIRGGTSTGRRVYEALQFLRNRVNLAAGTLTIYESDDTTSAWTAVVATEAVTAIITDINP